MPAMLEDPGAAPIYRVSGSPPFPDPAMPQLPPDIGPRQVTLRDRQTVATIVPLASGDALPETLRAYLCDQLNKEIEGGDTYPMMETFTVEGFTRYWFQNFGAVMLLGALTGEGDIAPGKDWSRECLGSFYIKPNYPGRSSHVCNAGFLVTDASRNRGVGRLMGEAYIDYAPRLGYTYSVFNLVYETNVASCRIWDALGFKRIGRVKACGNLRSHPDRLIDAIIYGRDLAPGDADDLLAISEERFDKIKYYLKFGRYPNGADRAEKSRLRSAATSYKLLDGDKLMLKGKEVISDPAVQLDIARSVHAHHHGGINKTTATIADKYHWSRIKETVSDVIRNCHECKDSAGPAATSSASDAYKKTTSSSTPSAGAQTPTVAAAAASTAHLFPSPTPPQQQPQPQLDDSAMAFTSSPPTQPDMTSHLDHHHSVTMLPDLSAATSSRTHEFADPSQLSSVAPSHTLHSDNPSLDQQQQQQQHHNHHHTAYHHHHHHHHQPVGTQMISQHHAPDNPFDTYNAHAPDFQALLSETTHSDDVDDADVAAQAAVDHDLDMLIDHHHHDVDVGVGVNDLDASGGGPNNPLLVGAGRVTVPGAVAHHHAGGVGVVDGHNGDDDDHNLLMAAQGAHDDAHRAGLYHDPHDDDMGFGPP